jgi:hypothetical protein
VRNIENLLIVQLTALADESDIGLKSSADALEVKHLRKLDGQKSPARIRKFHGNLLYKSFTPEPGPIGPGTVGMYLVAHGIFKSNTTLIAGEDPKAAAGLIDNLLQALRVSPENFKKLSLDVCNAARAKSTSELNAKRLEYAQSADDKKLEKKIATLETTVAKQVMERSALSVLCRELGERKWTPLVAGWDGYISVANVDVGPRYVYVDDDGNSLTKDDMTNDEMLKKVGRDALTKNIGRKVHSTPQMLHGKAVQPDKLLVKDLEKSPVQKPEYSDGKAPLRGSGYRAKHKFVLQYRNGLVQDVKIDLYHNAF